MVLRVLVPLFLLACAKAELPVDVELDSPTDTLPQDTVPGDTVPDDTVPADTVPDDSDAIVDSDPEPPCSVGLSVGDCPPDFTLDSVGGTSVTLSQLGAQRVIVIGTSNW